MANTREIRQRMRSISNIGQITKAMKMVAAARLRRAQERATSSHPFADKIESLLNTALSDKTLASHLSVSDFPLLESRSIKKTGFIVVSADKGLAGAYNSNLLKYAMAEVADCEEYYLITSGRKAKEYFQHRGFHIDKDFFGSSDKPTFPYAEELARAVTESFIAGELDEVRLIYTHFKSTLSQTPRTIQLLPISTAGRIEETFGDEEESDEMGDVIFEPDAKGVLQHLLPSYVRTTIYAALMQSAASELGARMTAMTSATDNATDLLRTLELKHNKARQAGITNEINEIVGGAEALQQS